MRPTFTTKTSGHSSTSPLLLTICNARKFYWAVAAKQCFGKPATTDPRPCTSPLMLVRILMFLFAPPLYIYRYSCVSVRALLSPNASFHTRVFKCLTRCLNVCLWCTFLPMSPGHLEMCHFLNDAGASLKALNRGGRTPLLEAAKYKHYAVV